MKGTRRAVAVLNILCTAVLYGVLVLVVFVVVAIIIVLLKQLLPDLFSFVDEGLDRYQVVVPLTLLTALVLSIFTERKKDIWRAGVERLLAVIERAGSRFRQSFAR